MCVPQSSTKTPRSSGVYRIFASTPGTLGVWETPAKVCKTAQVSCATHKSDCVGALTRKNKDKTLPPQAVPLPSVREFHSRQRDDLLRS